LHKNTLRFVNFTLETPVRSNKKAVLSQGNRAMPQLLFLV